jgi:Acetyl xylan esterase (AXE1)
MARREVRRGLIAVGLVGAAMLIGPGGAQAQVKPFGKLDCVPREGVRWCQGSIATRVKSFDGTPLDVNLALPATGDSNLPLAIGLHGWGGQKLGFSDAKPFAERGYAALSYSARGFGHSCGSEESRAAEPEGCRRGWVHLADTRWEARDSQYLAGLLADEGLVDPQRIGVLGASYGGGQSLELTTLRDKVRLGALPGEPDGQLVPWTSPQGKPMQIAATAPIVPWSDLVYSLVPNGRTLDYVVTGPNDDLSPIGIAKESYVAALYASGKSNGYYCGDQPGVPCDDPDADLNTWFALIQAGEPYNETVAGPILDEIAQNHSAYYLSTGQQPAPSLISNGFTDDLFPVDEALRYANKHAGATIAQLHFDYGHPRGQSKPADIEYLRARIYDWFDRYVKGDTSATPLSGAEALTQTCPRSAASGGPFEAASWAGLHPGEVRFGTAEPKTILSAAPDAVGHEVDPVASSGAVQFPAPFNSLFPDVLPGDLACETTSAADQAGTATYRGPAVRDGYTLLGSPTVTASVDVTSEAAARHTELAARLWDVEPDGSSQTLIARSLYRPAGDGRVVFQLHPNGWKFGAGHVPKLELLAHDAPYARPSNFQYTIAVSDLTLRLPVHEPPAGQVKKPLKPSQP